MTKRNFQINKFSLAFYFSLSLLPFDLFSQLPGCDKNFIYIIKSGPPTLYKFDLTQPYINNVKPAIINITLPPNSFALAIGRNLFSNNPFITYYIGIVDLSSGYLYYHYFDGSSWVNTHHRNLDGGFNIGMGNKYIFSYNPATNNISRYDGTSDAAVILHLTPGISGDIAVDCQDNFYIRNANFKIAKYDSSGNLITIYNMINQPSPPGGVGGIAIIDNHLYCGGNGFFYQGIINNNNITFSQGLMPFMPSLGDFGVCAGGFSQSLIYDTICSNQLPYMLNGQTYSNSGIYNTTLSGVEGCDSVITLDLTVKPSPNVNLGPDTSLCLDKSLILDATTPGGAYVWQDGSTNPIFKVTNSGYYWVSLSVGNCNISDTIKVEMLDCSCTYSIPNAITPNGDEINDSWVISRQGNCKTINIFVYNRYGSLVYQKYDYQNDWKGTYKGHPLPDATYYYIVTTMTTNNTIKIFKGNITILR